MLFAGTTLNKCIDLRVGMLTGLGKSPPVQVKEPYGNLDMVTCRGVPAYTQSTQLHTLIFECPKIKTS